MKQETDDYLKLANTIKSADRLFRYVENHEDPPKSYACNICNEFS